MSKILFLLDNGHGAETPGKRSPVFSDGSQLFEWKFNREIVNKIAKGLDALKIPYVKLVPENNDIPLVERVRRANVHHIDCGKTLLISVHGNAGGGTGWEVFTSKGQTASDRYAQVFFNEAAREFPEFRMRADRSDGDDDKEENFYILKNTIGPAILTENFFMDSERDAMLMMSEEGKDRIAKIHINAIKKIYDED